MASGTNGGLAGALIVAAGVALVAVASRAKASTPAPLTRAQTDAAFHATLYRFVSKTTMDTIKAKWAAAQGGGVPQAKAAELLISEVVKLVPWESIVAFNRAIVPMLEAGTATIPGTTPAFQRQVINGVKAYGLTNPKMPPQYAAVQGAVGFVMAGL